MTLLEGSGNGLPLLSFDIPTGPNEIIEDEKNGYLIKAFDVEDMAKKIENLICNQKLRNLMSQESKKRCQLFTEKEVISQWVDILKRI